jgi:hypothetical protein
VEFKVTLECRGKKEIREILAPKGHKEKLVLKVYKAILVFKD